MDMLRRGVMAGWLVLGMMALGAATDIWASELSGVYCARGGDDILVIEERDSRLGFELSSWQGGMHHCGTGRLTATRQGDGYAVTDGACTLHLASDGTDITLAATPIGECKNQYCGARAVLDTLSIPLASRRPLPLPFDEISLMETPLCQ